MINKELCPICNSLNDECYECFGRPIDTEQRERILYEIRQQLKDDDDFERFKINELFNE
jgi:hypothetical protein